MKYRMVYENVEIEKKIIRKISVSLMKKHLSNIFCHTLILFSGIPFISFKIMKPQD